MERIINVAYVMEFKTPGNKIVAVFGLEYPKPVYEKFGLKVPSSVISLALVHPVDFRMRARCLLADSQDLGPPRGLSIHELKDMWYPK